MDKQITLTEQELIKLCSTASKLTVKTRMEGMDKEWVAECKKIGISNETTLQIFSHIHTHRDAMRSRLVYLMG